MNYINEMAYSEGYIEGVMKAMEEMSCDESYYEEDDYAYESYYDDYDIANEGNNIDAAKMNRNYGKEMKTLVKEARRLKKEGNTSGAKAKYLKAAKVADKLARDVDKLDPSAGSAVLGAFAYALKMGVASAASAAVTGAATGLSKGMVKAITAGVGTAATAGSVVGAGLGASIATLIRKIQGEKNISPNDYNMYTNEIKGNAKRLADYYRTIAKRL